MATQKQVARHLDLTSRSVRELLERGVLPPATRGELDVDACRVAYVRHLRAAAAGRGAGSGDLDLVAERARLAKEQADQAALKNAQLRGELIPAADHEESLIALASGVALRIRAVPTRAAPEVRLATTDREAEELLRRFIDEALEELADAGDAMLEQAAARERGGAESADASAR